MGEQRDVGNPAGWIGPGGVGDAGEGKGEHRAGPADLAQRHTGEGTMSKPRHEQDEVDHGVYVSDPSARLTLYGSTTRRAHAPQTAQAEEEVRYGIVNKPADCER